MFLTSKVFLLCGFLPFVLTSTVHKLIEEFQAVKAKIKTYDQANKILAEKLNKVNENVTKALEDDSNHIYNVTIDEEVEKLKVLKSNLKNKYNEEATVLKEIDKKQEILFVYKFKLDLLTHDIALFKSRRASGEANKCKTLENGRTIALRSSFNGKYKIANEEMILRNQIKRLSSVLTFNELMNKEYNKEIKEKVTLLKEMKKAFKDNIWKNVYDFATIAEEIYKVNEEIKNVTSGIVKSKIKCTDIIKNINQTKTDINRLVDTLYGFKDDQLCYLKIYRRVTSDLLKRYGWEPEGKARILEVPSDIMSAANVSTKEVPNNNASSISVPTALVGEVPSDIVSVSEGMVTVPSVGNAPVLPVISPVLKNASTTKSSKL